MKKPNTLLDKARNASGTRNWNKREVTSDEKDLALALVGNEITPSQCARALGFPEKNWTNNFYPWAYRVFRSIMAEQVELNRLRKLTGVKIVSSNIGSK